MSPRRELSEFLCRELLYDFATDNLDEVRRKAVQESLHHFPDLEDELDALKNGIEYIRAISKTEATQPLVDAIQKEYGIQAVVRKISLWPRWIKWTAEAILVAALVMGSVNLIPDEYWYAATDYWTLKDMSLADPNPEIAMNEEPVNSDQAQQIKEEESGGKGAATESIEPTEKLLAVNKGKGNTSEPEAVTPAVVVSSTDQSVATPVAAPRKGYVYRMYMFSSRVDEITPLVVNKIESLGGKKAGEVRLGWRKSQGSYFHFTIPEKSYSDLTSFVSQFGDLRISKDDHKRVMPEGTERFILWIEEINPKTPKGNDDGEEQSQ